MTASDVIEFSHSGGIARLHLNRPAQGNAINDVFCRELRSLAEGLHERSDVRAVVLSAAGKSYCVGGDLQYFSTLDDVEGALIALAEDFHAGIFALRTLNAPVITAVQGVAAGGGLSLACTCDIVIASDVARFTAAYTAAGLSPDGGLSHFLPRTIGWRAAEEMMLLNRVLGAEEAQRIGLVNSVVAADELESAVEAAAAQIATGATAAYGTVKELLRLSAENSLEEQLALEGRSIARNAASPDGVEGVGAFLAKRKPEFRGNPSAATAT